MSKTPDSTHVMVELKEVIGSIIFASHRAVTVNEIRKCMMEAAEKHGKEAKVFEAIKPADIKKALDALCADVAKAKLGFVLKEVPGGFRFQSDARSGPWLKVFLNKAKPNRLSRPGLETLAIIAYRQPITKAEIERIRGVGIDHVMKALMEAQLVRIVGRSELPGRPFLYGSTQLFLEHFGLKDLESLKDREMLAAMDVNRGAVRHSTGHDSPEDREQLALSLASVGAGSAATAVKQVHEEAFINAGNSVADEDDPSTESDAPDSKIDMESTPDERDEDEFAEEDGFADEDEFDDEDEFEDDEEDGDEP